MQKEDIIYVQVVKRKIVIYTENEVHCGYLTSQLELLLHCFGFERANSNQYVQMNKILIRDKKEKKIYFNAEKTKYCRVTRSHKDTFFW